MSATAEKIPGWFQARSRTVLYPPPDRFADYILRRFGVVEPPVPVDSIASSLGVQVLRVANPGWSGAALSNETTATAWINSDEPLARQRFTLAHELGHLLLHPLGVEFRDASFAGSPRETEANKFAAALLMPLWMVERFARPRAGTPQALAGIFDVSQHAMSVRYAELYGQPVAW